MKHFLIALTFLAATATTVSAQNYQLLPEVCNQEITQIRREHYARHGQPLDSSIADAIMAACVKRVSPEMYEQEIRDQQRLQRQRNCVEYSQRTGDYQVNCANVR